MKPLKKNEEAITAIVPNLQKAKFFLKVVEYSNTLSKTLPQKTGIILIIAALIVAFGIYAINFRKFKGFLWLMIDFGISAFLLLGIIIFTKVGLLGNLSAILSNVFTQIIDFAVSLCIDTMAIGFTVLTVLFAAFGIIYTLLWKKTSD